MKFTTQHCKLLLLSSLYFSLPAQADFDFCTANKSLNGINSNSFQQEILEDGLIEIGEIPKGVKNVEIILTSTADLDIQLIDKSDNTKIVQWPDGILNQSLVETKSYKTLDYEWSGYAGDCPNYDSRVAPEGCSYGNEYIKVLGISNETLVMKAFGYQAGQATVEYRWEGGEIEACKVPESGKGEFEQILVEKTLVDIGEIPAGLVNVDIRLLSNTDLDIQLIDKETGDQIVQWPDGLLKDTFPSHAVYKGLDYAWSGYAGDCEEYIYPEVPDNCSYGNEYINITGKTDRALVMKAYAYQSGTAKVQYSWGKANESIDDALLARFAPVMSFYADDSLPSPIEAFLSHAVLYKQTLFGRKPIAYGTALPETIYRKFLFFKKAIDTTSKPMSTNNMPDVLADADGTYFLDYLNDHVAPISASDVYDGYDDENGNKLSYEPTEVMQDYDRVIYGRVFRQTDRIYLQYHFFYLVNQWNGNGGNLIGFHEGDWEGMIVELNGNGDPLRVGTSIHLKILTFKGGETRNWVNVSKSGEHPIVYIGKGGHPTYMHKGRTPVAFGITGTDKHDGTGIILRNENNINVDSINANADKQQYRIVNIEEDANVSQWMNAKLLWGNDFTDFIEKSVNSVKYFDPNRWNNPRKWLNDRD